MKKTANIIGSVLLLISLFYIFQNIKSLNLDYIKLITPTNISMIITMPFLTVIVIFFNSYCWRMILSLFTNSDIPVGKTFSIYAKANIMKYLPGNVGHYAGKQLLGTQLGFNQMQLATASVLEIVYSSVSMFLCAFIFSSNTFLQIFRTSFLLKKSIYWGILGAVILLAIILIMKLLKNHKYVIMIKRGLKSIAFWKAVITSVLLFSLGSTISVLEYVILASQYISLDFQLMFLLISANFFATFIGFITPGVPGGIGVREAALLVILSSVVSKDIIILTAVTHRAIMISGDSVTVFISRLFIK